MTRSSRTEPYDCVVQTGRRRIPLWHFYMVYCRQFAHALFLRLPAAKEEPLRVWQDEIAALKRLNMPQTEKRYEARKGNMPRGLPHTIIEYVPFTRSTSVCLYVVL